MRITAMITLFLAGSISAMPTPDDDSDSADVTTGCWYFDSNAYLFFVADDGTSQPTPFDNSNPRICDDGLGSMGNFMKRVESTREGVQQ
jgi:hypothetical protein